jgi:hypothetical protein
MSEERYLSFVVSARNDNYGGNFLGRMQTFLNAWAYLCRKHRVDAELVIVEWNPPAERLRLVEALRWPKDMAPERMRIIEVPREIHERTPNAHRMPIFEYMGKNVGIRRARGKFILATNPDILFSQGLMKYFAARQLEENAYYRVDRHDVAEEVPPGWSVERQLRFCAHAAFRAHRMEGSVALRDWRETLNVSIKDVMGQAARRRYLLSPRWLAGETLKRIRAIKNSTADETPKRMPAIKNPRPKPLCVHTNACGDFLLMEAKAWKSLRGFPELTTHSHIDSYMVYQAAISGLRQVVLRQPIYHQEHDRSEQAARPLTVLDEIPGLRRMQESRQLEIANSPEWGLGSTRLASVPVCDSVAVGLEQL